MPSSTLPSAVAALCALSALVSPAVAHTWPERVKNIGANGQDLVGDAGYIRNFGPRAGGNVDGQNSNRITDTTQKPLFCKSNQQSRAQTGGFPTLKTASNGRVAIQWLENGHVSFPKGNVDPTGKPGQPDRPAGSGEVRVYMSKDSINPTLDEVLSWDNSADPNNRFIAHQPYDDGSCYQIPNPSLSPGDMAISQGRVRHEANPNFNPTWKVDNSDDLPCEIDIQLPNLEEGTWSVFWFWNYTMTSTLADPHNQEFYTGCMDFEIGAPLTDGQPAGQKREEAARKPMAPSLLAAAAKK